MSHTASVGPDEDNRVCMCEHAGRCWLGDVCHSRLRHHDGAPACYHERSVKERKHGKGKE